MRLLDIEIKRIEPHEPFLMDGLLDLLAEAFCDRASYCGNRPGKEYMEKLLRSETFVALAAMHRDSVIGGLAAYELVKFEQQRSEFYIYDLAVHEQHRRRGVATQLISALKPIALARGAEVIFVQADYGDDPAIAVYSRLGTREDVIHFDIATR